MKEALVTVRGLRKSFGAPAPRTLFDALDLDLSPGEFIAVMGESGSGKSSLLNLIAGLELPDAGSIVFDGTDIAALTEDQRAAFRRQQLGFVFQAFLLLPYLTVAENVALPLVLNGRALSERSSRVQEALAEVGLRERADSRPHELSGGEAQRVAIARALIHRPRLLLADEPTGNLDAEHAQQVLQLLRSRVKKDAAACILVTHSPAAARCADRAYLLAAGRLQQQSV